MARNIRNGLTMVAVAIAFALGSWANAQTPAATAGDAAASVQTPRMPDGRPNLSGMWSGGAVDVDPERPPQPQNFVVVGGKLEASGNVTELYRARGCHPGMRSCHAAVNQSTDSTFTGRLDPNRPLYKPQYWDRVQYLDRHTNSEDPTFSCDPRGVPRIGTPQKIVQTPTEIILFYDRDVRVIPIDGRKHDPLKSTDLYFNGHAVGRWEGDTLVIDSVAFNDASWLRSGGYFHSNNMTVVERFTRQGNQIRYQAIVTDPDVLLEPWRMNERLMRLNPDPLATWDEPLACDERDKEHMVGLIHH